MLKQNIKNGQWMNNLNLHDKLILIYFVCGVLPLLLFGAYTTVSSRNNLISQAKESEQNELYLLETTICENMRIITDVSLKMYFDPGLEKISQTQYDTYETYITDYRNYDTIDEYLNDYTHELSSMSIYLENDTITDSSRFVRVNDTIRCEEWYQQALRLEGGSFLCYRYENVWHKSFLTLIRQLRTENGKKVGVLVMLVKNELLYELLSGREYETVLVLDRESVIATNSEETKEDEILELLKKYGDSGESVQVQYRGEECVLTVLRLPSDKTYGTAMNEIALVSVHPYKDILAQTNQSLLAGILIAGVCVAASFLLISAFSYGFSRRITYFKEQMHKVAGGDFEIVKKVSGSDEISELYNDLYTMIDSMQHLLTEIYEEKLQKEQLNSRQKDVEFKMLASQINPHFLYNTLETIRMKARVNEQPEIEELVKMLAKIMRRNIQVGDNLVPFRSELELVEYYLKIQQYRFGDRIHYQVELSCDISEYKIMPLLIQPIVENAFVHGLEQQEGGGEIRIVVENTDKLRIHIIDNGCGMTAKELNEINQSLNDFTYLDRSHIGLSNVNQRIQLMYGEHYGLIITSQAGKGTEVVMELPGSR